MQDKCLASRKIFLILQVSGRPPMHGFCANFQLLEDYFVIFESSPLPINRGEHYSFYSQKAANLCPFFCKKSREREGREREEKNQNFLKPSLG